MRRGAAEGDWPNVIVLLVATVKRHVPRPGTAVPARHCYMHALGAHRKRRPRRTRRKWLRKGGRTSRRYACMHAGDGRDAERARAQRHSDAHKDHGGRVLTHGAHRGAVRRYPGGSPGSRGARPRVLRVRSSASLPPPSPFHHRTASTVRQRSAACGAPECWGKAVEAVRVLRRLRPYCGVTQQRSSCTEVVTVAGYIIIAGAASTWA